MTPPKPSYDGWLTVLILQKCGCDSNNGSILFNGYRKSMTSALSGTLYLNFVSGIF
jgi:hypothetical protein